MTLGVRLLLSFALSAGLVSIGASPAQAWANGVDGPDSYGTHDWVLDKALDALGAKADWVCLHTALKATDDPDTKDGIDHASGTWWHVYDIWGETWGGAPEAAKVWFDRAGDRLAAGRECAASKALGIMAHIVADIAQPMHTDGSLAAEDRVHSPYESAVDSRSEASDRVYRFAYDGVDQAAPFARTVRLAKAAHKYYRTLVKTYDAHGYNARVNRITKRELNRAANAVADLVSALS